MLGHLLPRRLHQSRRRRRQEPPSRLGPRVPHGLPPLEHALPSLGPLRRTLPQVWCTMGSRLRYQRYAEVPTCATHAGWEWRTVGWDEESE